MHAHGQGFNEEHQRPVNGVTPLLRDGDHDTDHLKVKALAVNEFVARKKPHGNRGVPQAHACQLKVIVITNKLDKPKIGA